MCREDAMDGARGRVERLRCAQCLREWITSDIDRLVDVQTGNCRLLYPEMNVIYSPRLKEIVWLVRPDAGFEMKTPAGYDFFLLVVKCRILHWRV